MSTSSARLRTSLTGLLFTIALSVATWTSIFQYCVQFPHRSHQWDWCPPEDPTYLNSTFTSLQSVQESACVDDTDITSARLLHLLPHRHTHHGPRDPDAQVQVVVHAEPRILGRHSQRPAQGWCCLYTWTSTALCVNMLNTPNDYSCLLPRLNTRRWSWRYFRRCICQRCTKCGFFLGVTRLWYARSRPYSGLPLPNPVWKLRVSCEILNVKNVVILVSAADWVREWLIDHDFWVQVGDGYYISQCTWMYQIQMRIPAMCACVSREEVYLPHTQVLTLGDLNNSLYAYIDLDLI